MPSTDSRSREEWLAEVRRRGERIRRRRRFTLAAVAAFALVLPISAVAGYLVAPPERAVELSVAGPAPVRGMEPLPAPPNEPATGDAPAAAATADVAPTTTVAEVHERVATINGVPGPRSSSPTSVPPTDAPVVGRSTPATTIPASGSTPSTVPGLMASSAPPAAAEPGLALPECVANEFRLTVSTEKSAYGSGEHVSGSSILEKRSPGRCLMPQWWLEISFLNAAGQDVSDLARESSLNVDIAASMDSSCGQSGCRYIVEPGAVITHLFGWETVDCTNVPPVRPVPPDDSHCVPFPGGTYTVLSLWTGPGSGPRASTTVHLGL